MAAEINTLLAQAVEQAGELAGRLSEAGETLDAALGAAAGAFDSAVEGVDSVRERLHDLAKELDECVARVETAGKNVHANLEKLELRSVRLRSRHVSYLTVVKTALGDLEAYRAHLRDDLHGSFGSAEGELADLARRASDLAAAIERELPASLEAVGALQAVLGGARDEMGRNKDAFRQALSDLATAATRPAETVARELDSLLVEQSLVLVDLGNAMITAHNAAREELIRTMVEAIRKSLDAAAESLAGVMERLTEAADEREQELAKRGEKALGLASDVLAFADLYRPVLALAPRLR